MGIMNIGLKRGQLLLDMNGIHQAFAYVDINLIGDDIRAIERNVDVLKSL